MSVVGGNQGPLSPETAITAPNEQAILTNIWIELKIISILLRQAFSITDDDAALRNSITVSDLQNLE